MNAYSNLFTPHFISEHIVCVYNVINRIKYKLPLSQACLLHCSELDGVDSGSHSLTWTVTLPFTQITFLVIVPPPHSLEHWNIWIFKRVSWHARNTYLSPRTTIPFTRTFSFFGGAISGRFVFFVGVAFIFPYFLKPFIGSLRAKYLSGLDAAAALCRTLNRHLFYYNKKPNLRTGRKELKYGYLAPLGRVPFVVAACRLSLAFSGYFGFVRIFCTQFLRVNLSWCRHALNVSRFFA